MESTSAHLLHVRQDLIGRPAFRFPSIVVRPLRATIHDRVDRGTAAKNMTNGDGRLPRIEMLRLGTCEEIGVWGSGSNMAEPEPYVIDNRQAHIVDATLDEQNGQVGVGV